MPIDMQDRSHFTQKDKICSKLEGVSPFAHSIFLPFSHRHSTDIVLSKVTNSLLVAKSKGYVSTNLSCCLSSF